MLYNGNNDFYPTPAHLAQKMLDKVNFKEVTTVLEPSAGKGDLIEMIKQKEGVLYGYKFDIDAIEKDANLRHILNGKEYRTVHDDFLTKAWKINKKVIIPLTGYGFFGDRYEPTHYQTLNKLQDIEKCFNYLDGGLTDAVDLKQSLEFAEQYGETKNIQLKYFTVTFYKKGTCLMLENKAV